MSPAAVPVAGVARKSTGRPFRFSISACPINRSLASLPLPFRIRRVAGSVGLAWVALDRRSPRKATLGFPWVTAGWAKGSSCLVFCQASNAG